MTSRTVPTCKAMMHSDLMLLIATIDRAMPRALTLGHLVLSVRDTRMQGPMTCVGKRVEARQTMDDSCGSKVRLIVTTLSFRRLEVK